MIRKLAEELAQNSIVPGENNIRPLQEPTAPPLKDDATPDPNYGFTSHSGEGHAQTTLGVLDRSLSNAQSAAQDHERVLTQVLGEHVKRVSGSSATSQRAMQRFQSRKKR